MNNLVASTVVWLAIIGALIAATDLTTRLFGQSIDPKTGVPSFHSTLLYVMRYLLEALVFSFVGIACARFVRVTWAAGLFVLSVGTSYVVYREWLSPLWYYMAAHPSRLDQFFFTAPILAPVIFPVGACLIMRAITDVRAEPNQPAPRQ